MNRRYLLMGNTVVYQLLISWSYLLLVVPGKNVVTDIGVSLAVYCLLKITDFLVLNQSHQTSTLMGLLIIDLRLAANML